MSRFRPILIDLSVPSRSSSYSRVWPTAIRNSASLGLTHSGLMSPRVDLSKRGLIWGFTMLHLPPLVGGIRCNLGVASCGCDSKKSARAWFYKRVGRSNRDVNIEGMHAWAFVPRHAMGRSRSARVLPSCPRARRSSR
jgi:hypothetical protein